MTHPKHPLVAYLASAGGIFSLASPLSPISTSAPTTTQESESQDPDFLGSEEVNLLEGLSVGKVQRPI